MREKLISAQILSANLKRLTGDSVREWCGGRSISRIINFKQSPSVALLETIAEKSGNLMVWHLLLPNLDPSNPPVVTFTATELRLYKDLKDKLKQLPDMEK